MEIKTLVTSAKEKEHSKEAHSESDDPVLIGAGTWERAGEERLQLDCHYGVILDRFTFGILCAGYTGE